MKQTMEELNTEEKEKAQAELDDIERRESTEMLLYNNKPHKFKMKYFFASGKLVPCYSIQNPVQHLKRSDYETFTQEQKPEWFL